MIDDTAGYHARDTEWRWSAGVGAGEDGAALAWNLVSGVNDPAARQRARGVGGGQRAETPPVRFARGPREHRLRGRLAAGLPAPRRERSRRENLLILRSDYHAPFGTFSGTLPGGIALASGHGVVEHHRARW